MFSRLRETALRAARAAGPPSFYLHGRKELESSSASYFESSLIKRCRSYLDESKLHPAHGVFHCEKVALEAGAVLLIEGSETGLGADQIQELMMCVHIAGLLHDIKRAEKDHTVAGSKEAASILKDFPIEERCKRYIVAAIRNHEAFKEVLDSEDPSARLVSDSLYDADKFRWGPDNFTVTLWLITESAGITVDDLSQGFTRQLEVIKSIRKTFRTGTGRRYGPEFIDKGIMIGDEIYREIKANRGIHQ